MGDEATMRRGILTPFRTTSIRECAMLTRFNECKDVLHYTELYQFIRRTDRQCNIVGLCKRTVTTKDNITDKRNIGKLSRSVKSTITTLWHFGIRRLIEHVNGENRATTNSNYSEVDYSSRWQKLSGYYSCVGEFTGILSYEEYPHLEAR